VRLFDDLSETQVAQILGCATGTVRATLALAIARLRTHPQLADLVERRT
jgi:DNA-directed RNA polymerase specialized sigma24 family protein